MRCALKRRSNFDPFDTLTLKDDIVSVGEDEGAAGAVIFLERPRRLARPRTPPFHGDNMGSNPIGDTKSFQRITLKAQHRASILLKKFSKTSL